MRSDEYDRIYGEEPIGFLFNCGKRLSVPISLSAIDISKMPVTCGNDDQIYIHCNTCDVLMKFSHGPLDNMDGKWICPDCGRSVRESTPYKRLDEANRKFESELLDDDYDDLF